MSGFKSLGQAIDGIRTQIELSIDSLATSLDNMTNSIDNGLSDIHSRIGDVVDGAAEQHEKYLELDRAHTEREVAALGMLDNIQHKRLPK